MICVDPLSAILLPVAQFLAENASCFVSVGVVAWPRIVVRAGSPQLLVVAPIVVLWPVVLTILLATILCVGRSELFLSVLGNGLHIVILFFLLHSLNLG